MLLVLSVSVTFKLTLFCHDAAQITIQPGLPNPTNELTTLGLAAKALRGGQILGRIDVKCRACV
jgi:hypothetical protein